MRNGCWFLFLVLHACAISTPGSESNTGAADAFAEVGLGDEVMPSVDTIPVLAVGDAVTAELPVNTSRWYRIALPANTRIDVILTASDGAIPVLAFYGAFGAGNGSGRPPHLADGGHLSLDFPSNQHSVRFRSTVTQAGIYGLRIGSNPIQRLGFSPPQFSLRIRCGDAACRESCGSSPSVNVCPSGSTCQEGVCTLPASPAGIGASVCASDNDCGAGSFCRVGRCRAERLAGAECGTHPEAAREVCERGLVCALDAPFDPLLARGTCQPAS